MKQIFATKGIKFAVEKSTNPEFIATLKGTAIVYGVLTGDRGGYRVRFLKGSAKPAEEVHALYAHDESKIIGNTANGTLRITSDDIGVHVEIDVPDTTTGRDVEELVENGYVNGMSFALVEGDSTTKEENGEKIVEYSTFTYDEVTITSVPAVVQTSIAIKEDNVPEDDSAELQKKKADSHKELSAAKRKLDLLRLSITQL